MKMWWGDSDFGFSDKMCLFLKHWLCVLTDGKENSRRLEIIVFLVFTVCLSLFALLSYLHRSSEVKAKEPPKTWVLFRMQFLGWSNFVSGKSELSRLLIQMITGNLAIPTSDLFRSAPIEAKKSFELIWVGFSIVSTMVTTMIREGACLLGCVSVCCKDVPLGCMNVPDNDYWGVSCWIPLILCHTELNLTSWVKRSRLPRPWSVKLKLLILLLMSVIAAESGREM